MQFLSSRSSQCETSYPLKIDQCSTVEQLSWLPTPTKDECSRCPARRRRERFCTGLRGIDVQHRKMPLDVAGVHRTPGTVIQTLYVGWISSVVHYCGDGCQYSGIVCKGGVRRWVQS